MYLGRSDDEVEEEEGAASINEYIKELRQQGQGEVRREEEDEW